MITRVSTVEPQGAANEACLVVIYGAELGKKFDLEESRVVGRSESADISIDHESVSRQHFRVAVSGNKYILEDLESTNGTYVNDESASRIVLHDGDYIKAGKYIFKFLTGDNVEREYHEEIYRLTTMDGLTQAYNKRFLLEVLDKEMGRASRYERPLSLIMFDIDHFKSVNDEHGHLAGDYILKHLALIVQSHVRREDIVARYGGEEFCIVLPETAGEDAAGFAEKIRILVEGTSFAFEGKSIPITISIGVAQYRTETLVEAFIKVADERLYEAKRTGRNRVCYYNN